MPTNLSQRSRRRLRKQLSRGRDAAPVRRFEENISRADLAAALERDDGERAALLLEMLQDPRYQNHSLPLLCKKVGMSYLELFSLFRRSQLNEGMVRMLKHIPDVLEDTAIDAESKVETCWKCNGNCYVGRHSKLCRVCHGSGKIRKIGDSAARRLVFESAGLISRRGSQVNLSQQNVHLSNGELESLESTLTNAQKVLDASELEPRAASDESGPKD